VQDLESNDKLSLWLPYYIYARVVNSKPLRNLGSTRSGEIQGLVSNRVDSSGLQSKDLSYVMSQAIASGMDRRRRRCEMMELELVLLSRNLGQSDLPRLFLEGTSSRA
jgi:hypothetical protein